MSDARGTGLQWAQAPQARQAIDRVRAEAERRGHVRQTVYAGVGGLAGGALGSFKGPGGAAIGALVGALFGALLGADRDRAAREAPAGEAHGPHPQEPHTYRSPPVLAPGRPAIEPWRARNAVRTR